MEKWIQKLSGAMIASVLALTLSTRASADLQSEDADPDQPLPQIEEEAPKEESFPGEEPAVPEVDGSSSLSYAAFSSDNDSVGGIVLLSTDDPESGLPDAGDSGDTDDTGDDETGGEGSGTISLGDTDFTPGESDSIDLSGTTSDEGDLFGFDAGDPDDAADDCFYMVNYDGSGESLTSEDSDINIVASGLNRIGSIIADGDVNLTGTGILLVDNVELSEGCGFFLHPIEGIYQSGSVAVFLLTGPADAENGTNAVYTLLNGSDVPGILDEAYVIPEGIDLVIPSGAALILESVVRDTIVEHMDENGETVPGSVTTYPSASCPALVYDPLHNYTYSAANLTIPASSGLIVQDGASVTCNSFCALGGQPVIPLITVSGTLEGAGVITGGVIKLDPTASVDAAFRDSTLYNSAQDICLAISGSCSLISSDGSSISRIDLSEDASLECYAAGPYLSGSSSTWGDCSVFLTGAITGSGTVTLHSGSYFITNPDFVLGDTVTVSASTVTIEDISGQLTHLDYSGPCIVVDPDNTVMPETDEIPVVSVVIGSESHIIPSGSFSWGGSVTEGEPVYLSSSLLSEGVLSFSDLADAYWAEFSDNGFYYYYYIEVYTISDGELVRYVIGKDEAGNFTDGSVPADQIWLIRLLSYFSFTDGAGGGAILSTNTAATGSGIIGGSGAGSISGGAGSSIFTGTGITDPGNGNGNGNNNGDDNGNGNNNGDDNGNGNNNGNGTNNGDDNGSSRPSNPLQNVVTSVEIISSEAGASSLEDLNAVYTLSAVSDGQVLSQLNGTVTVRFSCPAPQTSGLIFAVFRDADGSLKVFKARYDRIRGQLVFDCDMVGDFAVVCLDYDGELYSDEFYALLETYDSVKKLI